MTRPKPRHSGQAPTAELKLNMAALAGLKVVPQSGHVSPTA